MKLVLIYKIQLIATLLLLITSIAHSQSIGVKTNIIYWATTTPNLGAELAVSKKLTINVSGGYNPWEFNNQKKIKHWLIQSELRYWLCEKFEGHFLGIHVQGGEYNVGAINFLVFGNNTKDYRYEGYFVGGGIAYGYQWVLSSRWNLEATAGFGYNYFKYDKFYARKNEVYINTFSRPNWWGPTKIALNFIYIIK